MRLLLFILCTFACNISFGQKRPDLDTFVNENVLKGASEEVKQLAKKNVAHFYAIAFVFDKTGKIDTLYFSKSLNAETKQLYGLDNLLLKRIKKYDFHYVEYSSQTVLIPFYHYNSTDECVAYKSGFLNSFEGLLPEAIKNKPIIVRNPIINAHIPRISN